MNKVMMIALLSLLSGCAKQRDINPDYYLCNHVGHMKGLLDAGVVKAEPEFLKAKSELHSKFDSLTISKELCSSTMQNAYVLAYNTMKGQEKK